MQHLHFGLRSCRAMPEATQAFLPCPDQVKTNRSSVRLHINRPSIQIVHPNMKPIKATPKLTLPKWDDFFNQKDLKAAERLPCINVVCFWRQLVALAVTARSGTSARAQQWLVTAVIGNQSYFHLACISNSAEHFGSPVPILAPDTHIRAENVVLAPSALIPSLAPVWVARGLAGHCSRSRATTPCQCGHLGSRAVREQYHMPSVPWGLYDSQSEMRTVKGTKKHFWPEAD